MSKDTKENKLTLKPAQIRRRYGIEERTLRTMRENPNANEGDVPNWFPVCGRPHYPIADFDNWFERQKNKKNKRAKSAVAAVKAVKT